MTFVAVRLIFPNQNESCENSEEAQNRESEQEGKETTDLAQIFKMEVDPRSPEKASLYGKNNNPVAAVDVEMASQNNSALEEVSLKYFYEARPNRNEFE